MDAKAEKIALFRYGERSQPATASKRTSVSVDTLLDYKERRSLYVATW